MKVTRIAYSAGLNPGKYAQLVEQARRLGVVRAKVWREYGSVQGVGVGGRAIRDRWMRDGTADGFGVLANAWKETVRDAVADITAHCEAAKTRARQAIHRRTGDEAERKRLYTALKCDTWTTDPFLRRVMRRCWRRSRTRITNQIIVRSDQFKTYTLTDGGNVWLAIPGLERRSTVKIPLGTTVAPTGTLRVILRDGRLEVHYAIDAAEIPSSRRPVGAATIGVDKGYTEVLTDSDGHHLGTSLGKLLSAESDYLRVKNARRAKIHSVAKRAADDGDRAKAERIRRSNLGIVKRRRRRTRFEHQVRTETFNAVHAVTDKAHTIVAEDLTRTFAARHRFGKHTNRRLAAWTKGVTAEALANVSERRGSALRLVNAAYTSQVAPCCGVLGRRAGDRLHCTECGAVWHADHAGAINVLERDGDPDISLWTPHARVRQIIQERADRRRTRLPVQDSSPPRAESETSDSISNDHE
ncbi:zinc ribbon domain-containing protein [Glycomyces xiaoerkulensis]|uniref:zinc ribbon domain-containing protein n=1 Tax=Glycomyces xiaoerkulensis TaxID=2038139 RepID=UPI000C2682C8|nr:zinc ribbon domain-containing protein [Glycomyces xiaoerkulensis]